MMTRKLPSRTDYALIELPVPVCGRFIRLPDREECSYLMYLDDVIRFCLPMIFSGMEYDCFEAYAFKFTKDAEMEIDNDLRNGTLQKISKAVKSRKKGDALRVIYDAEMPKDLLKRVMNRLNLDKLERPRFLVGVIIIIKTDGFSRLRALRFEISALASHIEAGTERECEFAASYSEARKT